MMSAVAASDCREDEPQREVAQGNDSEGSYGDSEEARNVYRG